MENMGTPSDKRTMALAFLDVAVGQTVDTAYHFLEAANWNLDDAMQLFYVGNEGHVATSSYVPSACGLEEDRRNVYARQGGRDEVYPLHLVSNTAYSTLEIMPPFPATRLRSERTSPPIEEAIHAPSSSPYMRACVPDQIVRRKRGRPRKLQLVPPTTTPLDEPILHVDDNNAHGIHDAAPGSSSGPSIPPCAPGQIVQRRCGRPCKLQLVPPDMTAPADCTPHLDDTSALHIHGVGAARTSGPVSLVLFAEKTSVPKRKRARIAITASAPTPTSSRRRRRPVYKGLEPISHIQIHQREVLYFPTSLLSKEQESHAKVFALTTTKMKDTDFTLHNVGQENATLKRERERERDGLCDVLSQGGGISVLLPEFCSSGLFLSGQICNYL